MNDMTLDDYLRDFYSLDTSEQLDEDVELHDELNQKLFDGDKLKPEVLDKINAIVNLFIDKLAEDEIKIEVDDIRLVGSNVSYNYTKDSDLDIHIMANTKNFACPDNLYPLLYSAYKTIFNQKTDIDFYGIPVEVYVETEDSELHSNGIYSVRNNDWIKHPEREAIPEIDFEAVEMALQPFEDRFKQLEENPTQEDAVNLIADIYNQRKEGLATSDGEYSIQNLVFKTFRDRGYLDRAKELEYEAISNDLSLESYGLVEATNRGYLTDSDIYAYRQLLEQTVSTQVLVFSNGHFTINNVRENAANNMISKLLKLDKVESAHKIPSGKYDFTHHDFLRGIPERYYTINGKIKIV